MHVEDRIAALEERTRALEEQVGLKPLRAETRAPVPRDRVTPPLPRERVTPPPPRERVTPPPPRERVSPPPPSGPVSPPADETASEPPPYARVSVPQRPVVSAPRPRPAISAPRPRSSRELEDLVGGRLLAWVGGLAVAVGVIFLLAIAVTRGWIGPVERTLLAGLLSGGLLVAGIRAHGRKGRTDAAKAATAAGIVGLFATALVAGSVYHLIPAVIAIAGALAVGATATVLALRWRAPGIAALGILGALASPAALDALYSSSSIVLLLVAAASATAVLVWQRWTWLAFAAYAIATPQWIVYAVHVDVDAVVLPLLVAFGALAAAAAVGFEVRSRAGSVRIASILLLALNALVLGAVGVMLLDHASAWLVALSLAHLAVGVGGRRTSRISPDLAMAGLALGVVLADVAAARVLDGLPLVVGWAAGGVLFAGLMRVAVPGLDRHAALVGLGGHMLLALTNALLVAPAGSVTGQAALIVVAATSLISGRLAEEGRTHLRMALDSIAVALLAYVTALGLDGLHETLAFAAQTVALISIARRHRDDLVAVGAVVAYAGLTVAHAVVVLGPPEAIVHGAAQPLAAAVGLGAAATVVALTALINPRDPKLAAFTRGGAALIVVYATWVELDGLTLTLAMAAETLILIAIARRYRDDVIAAGSAVAVAALAAVQAVVVAAVAAPEPLIAGLAHPLTATAGIVAAAVVVALLGLVDPAWRPVTRGAATLLVLYAVWVELDGVALTLALAAETFALILVARRHREDPIAAGAALALAALTALDAVVVLASPDALIYGLDRPLAAAAGLAAATVAFALLGLIERRWAAPAALLALYLASVELVTPFADVPQHAQPLLSSLWALVGVGALIAGLVRDKLVLRQAGLALLAVTVAKVFLYDLAALTSIYRVASFIVLGLLLLAGAFAWQRIRPRPLEDLRKMPASLR
jgi:uncharacterized membrane protein